MEELRELEFLIEKINMNVTISLDFPLSFASNPRFHAFPYCFAPTWDRYLTETSTPTHPDCLRP